MPQNVEIKAKLTKQEFANATSIAAQLSNNNSQTLFQVDTFYHVANGRLKLRQFLDPETGLETAPAELIQYTRPDQSGPKLSSYRRVPVADKELASALTDALNVSGTVKKHRKVFFVDQTRVHLDRVEDLGMFLELEVVLQGDQSPEYGEQVATQIMEQLQIKRSSLVSGAYIDLLQESTS